MLSHIVEAAELSPVPITGLSKSALDAWRAEQPPEVAAWTRAVGFTAEPGAVALMPDGKGGLGRVLVGVGDPMRPWDVAGLPFALPKGVYAIEGAAVDANSAALGWALGGYRFDRYKKSDREPAQLVWPSDCDRAAVANAAEGTALVRDLVNTPANDMGPAELADVAEHLAGTFGAEIAVTVGDALLAANYPMIHAVGRASARAPRLIDLRWGPADAPKVTVVGKGVCFDSGGLDLKPAGAMLVMKKDMGGGAHALGLARMIMAAALPVRLRVLVPAVENFVSAESFRPLDVLPSRKGLTVEIGNTDAEGRLILADALADADGEAPALLIDFATLTGAARIALGGDLPALFSNQDGLAEELLDASRGVGDPLWHMPLWRDYAQKLKSPVADLNNTGEGGLAGAIVAALFLDRFVSSATPWVHLDVFAWNQADRPGRPKGGEAMGLRAVFELIRRRFAGG